VEAIAAEHVLGIEIRRRSQRVHAICQRQTRFGHTFCIQMGFMPSATGKQQARCTRVAQWTKERKRKTGQQQKKCSTSQWIVQARNRKQLRKTRQKRLTRWRLGATEMSSTMSRLRRRQRVVSKAYLLTDTLGHKTNFVRGRAQETKI